MRYTTIIDITEVPSLYRNLSCRILYLHLVLRSGYHDDDRDVLVTSIRRVAAETGLTESATRHALRQLEASGLLVRTGNSWRVTKWVMTKEITARARSAQAPADSAAQAERIKQQRAVELQYRRKSQEEADIDLIQAYERFLQQQRDGELGVVGRRFLNDNRERYEQLKKKKNQV